RPRTQLVHQLGEDLHFPLQLADVQFQPSELEAVLGRGRQRPRERKQQDDPCHGISLPQVPPAGRTDAAQSGYAPIMRRPVTRWKSAPALSILAVMPVPRAGRAAARPASHLKNTRTKEG